MMDEMQTVTAPVEANEMTKEQLIDDIMATLERIWGSVQNG